MCRKALRDRHQSQRQCRAWRALEDFKLHRRELAPICAQIPYGAGTRSDSEDVTYHGRSTLDFFQEGSVAGDCKIPDQLQAECYAYFGPQICAAISWICKKLTAVSHRSAESQINSLDAGLRIEGTPALNFVGWCSRNIFLFRCYVEPCKRHS